MKLIVYILLLFIPYCLLVQDTESMAVVLSIILILNIISNYRTKNKISYIDVWNIGFLYTVCGEMILSSQYLNIHQDGLTVVRYILIANVLVNIGFYTNIKPMAPNKPIVMSGISSREAARFGKRILNALLLLSTIYFIEFIGPALNSFERGRAALLSSAEGGSADIFRNVIKGISSIAPIMGAYYLRYYLKYKYKLRFIVVLLLCVIPQILWGTRYVLLFSLIAPIIVFFDRKKLSSKIIMGGIVTLMLLVVSINYIKLNRDNRTTVNRTGQNGFVKQVASLGSNEGIVDGTLDIFNYTHSHGYFYGEQSAFVLYFWVPRSIWFEKPTQLSYWLVRKNHVVSDVFSAAYGFWGELFMDFGYFSLLIIFFIGTLLKKLEILKDFYLKNRSPKAVFYIVGFPVLFLSIRSPQTAIINLLLIGLIYFLLNFLFTRFGLLRKRRRYSPIVIFNQNYP